MSEWEQQQIFNKGLKGGTLTLQSILHVINLSIIITFLVCGFLCFFTLYIDWFCVFVPYVRFFVCFSFVLPEILPSLFFQELIPVPK